MHITKSGKKMIIQDMDDDHLLNTLKIFKKLSVKGITVESGGGSTAEDMWYEEKIIFGKEALEYLNYYEYEQEANKRGLI